MIEKIEIDNGFTFYDIDEKFKQKCYECADGINKNLIYLNAFNKIYYLLNNLDFNKIKELWKIKDVEYLFCKNINPYITNLIIVLSYKTHQNNMNKYKLSNEQVKIHKYRVKQCFESDLINRNYNSVRISQMLWAIYFVRIRLIEVGILQYEYLDTIDEVTQIKIHIPSGNKLEIENVIKSIDNSKQLLPKIFKIKKMEYLCNSWLLSNQLNEIINPNSNIHKFYELFKVLDGDNCIDDILNFVYLLKECNDYNTLTEVTSLQALIKKSLLNNVVFKLGIGKLK